MRWSALVGPFVLFVPFVLVAPAHAQERVAVRDPGCDGELFRAGALLELLGMELADGGASLAHDDGDTIVALSSDACDAPSGAVEVVVVRGSREHRRTIVLDEPGGDARARVMALAVAELVIGTRVRAPDRPSAPAPAAPSRVREDAPSVAWNAALVLSAGGTYHPTASTGLGSVRAGARAIGPTDVPWRLEAALRVATGAGDLSRSPAQAHTLSLELAALLVAREGPVELGGGLQLAAGASWLRADDGDRTHDWIDPALSVAARGTLSARLAPALALAFDARVGWVALGAEVRRDAQVLVGVAGPTLAFDIGLVIALP